MVGNTKAKSLNTLKILPTSTILCPTDLMGQKLLLVDFKFCRIGST